MLINTKNTNDSSYSILTGDCPPRVEGREEAGTVWTGLFSCGKNPTEIIYSNLPPIKPGVEIGSRPEGRHNWYHKSQYDFNLILGGNKTMEILVKHTEILNTNVCCGPEHDLPQCRSPICFLITSIIIEVNSWAPTFPSPSLSPQRIISSSWKSFLLRAVSCQLSTHMNFC